MASPLALAMTITCRIVSHHICCVNVRLVRKSLFRLPLGYLSYIAKLAKHIQCFNRWYSIWSCLCSSIGLDYTYPGLHLRNRVFSCQSRCSDIVRAGRVRLLLNCRLFGPGKYGPSGAFSVHQSGSLRSEALHTPAFGLPASLFVSEVLTL